MHTPQVLHEVRQVDKFVWFIASGWLGRNPYDPYAFSRSSYPMYLHVSIIFHIVLASCRLDFVRKASLLSFPRSPCVLGEAGGAICRRSRLSLWPFRQLSDHIEYLRQLRDSWETCNKETAKLAFRCFRFHAACFLCSFSSLAFFWCWRHLKVMLDPWAPDTAIGAQPQWKPIDLFFLRAYIANKPADGNYFCEHTDIEMQHYAGTNFSPAVKVQSELPGMSDMAKLGAQFVYGVWHSVKRTAAHHPQHFVKSKSRVIGWFAEGR